MKRILLLTITLFYYSSLAAQLMPIDSLQLAFKKATTDTAKLSILFKNNPFQYLGKADLMLDLYRQGFVIAQHLNDKTNIYKAQFYTAMIYIYDKSDEGTGFQWLEKALVASEAEQNNRSIQSVYYAMGIVHQHQGNRDNMYKTFYQSVTYNEKATDPHDGVFAALSQNLYDDKRWNEYLDINKRWVSLMEKVDAPPAKKLNAYNGLADALSKFPDRKEESSYYFTKANFLLDNIPDLGNDADKLLLAASIYYKFNRQKEAIIYANKVLNLKKNDDYTLSTKGLTHQFLADVYENQENYPLSNIHLKAYQKFEIEQMQKRLTEESGRKVIKAEAERDLLLKQKEADSNRWWAILGFSLAILVLGGGIVVYRFYKREQERKKEVDAINATKDKLFSIIAHDLRSPIGTLKTHLMMTNYGMMSQAEFATTSQKLTNNVNALFLTLENLLQWAYSQLKGIKAEPENINLKETAETEIKFLTEIAHQKNISIVNDIAPSVKTYADANQVALIIRNLVSNSLKFTHSGGKIVLNTQNIEEGKILLTITDNGIGMPPELQKQLFSIQNKTSRQGTAAEKGQGLGLLLVKEMVEANHGTLSIESFENKGTVMNIQLPRSKE